MAIFAAATGLGAFLINFYGVSSVLYSLAGATNTSDIESVLGAKLSADANIYFPGSAIFTNATDRWQDYKSPNITIVVEVATQADVQATIQYANEKNLPFLAMAGGHGAIDSLGDVYNGIEIWMRKMNSVTISDDGTTATIGGGAKAKEVTDALWASNKQTVTGACECTGMVAPMLGGGHGFLQGQYGLIADQLISAEMVLANGTAVTVSNTTNPDLFWAIRGAGHNYGIVTSFTNKIYDVSSDDETWAYEMFIFTADRVEDLYTRINTMSANGTQVDNLINYSFFVRMDEIDGANPVVVFYVLYQGASSVPSEYVSPFTDIGPAVAQSGTVSYPDLPALTGNADTSTPCQHGTTSMRFPITTYEYNVTAQRLVFDKFSNLTTSIPAFYNSLFLFEGYSVGGVKAVSADSTAYPNRQDNLLISPMVVYTPNATLDAEAIAFGTEVRSILNASSGMNEFRSYVNYAHGDESLESMYGYEDWRQTKLKTLKKEYDPNGRFSFYAPIPSA